MTESASVLQLVDLTDQALRIFLSISILRFVCSQTPNMLYWQPASHYRALCSLFITRMNLYLYTDVWVYSLNLLMINDRNACLVFSSRTQNFEPWCDSAEYEAEHREFKTVHKLKLNWETEL